VLKFNAFYVFYILLEDFWGKRVAAFGCLKKKKEKTED